MTLKKFLHRYLLSIIFYGIIAIAFLSILGCITQQNDWKTECQVIEYYVEHGDTLWSIAQQHKPTSVYILDYIAEVEQLNDINSSTLYVGDTITIYTKGE